MLYRVQIDTNLLETEKFREALGYYLFRAYGKHYSQDRLCYGEYASLVDGVIEFLRVSGWQEIVPTGEYSRDRVPKLKARRRKKNGTGIRKR